MYNILLSLFFALGLSSNGWASVAGEVNKANGLYKQGKFDDSLDLYQEALGKNDKSPVIKYDLGTDLYKKGDYAKALDYLEQASQGNNVKIKPKAEYNLGNVLYRSGIQKENTNVDEAIRSLQEALGHYGQALAIDPRDQDAVFNQDLVKKEIERLKQKKQQQQEQQQNHQQNQKQEKNSRQNKQGDQNRQDQQNQQAQQKYSKGQRSETNAPKQQNAQAQARQEQNELDRQQAQNMLEDYQENEEPKKLLNYMPRKIDDRPVLKDW